MTWSKLLGLIGKIYIGAMSVVCLISAFALSISHKSFLLFFVTAVGGIIFTVVSSAFIMTFAEIGDNINDMKIKTVEQKDNSNPIYKVRVIKPFKDAKSGKVYSVGDEFDITKSQFEKINSTGSFIEIIKEVVHKKYVGFGQYE